ncbi:hypothetical protein H257_16375 [Aphanomyces astaci]|uniref:Uncharacterized protein n=1 Tax=Aphanomyces astaci TaxID=112090 RepID=W4FIQ5_APHAT|nr:hypothetical protein H257_16375 [Aphanomyces astaci]ETV67397.1 hypothetical protein H257_16375 [Aphanomyces astaci]|eukprot:XP_009843088.1 hypothetical protein H257_16375 [Aphanomyces astaci]
MEPEPATPRAPAPPTTYDARSLSDHTLDDGFYSASVAAATSQPEAATEPMTSLPRVQTLPRIPETSAQKQGYPPGAAYGGLPAQSYRPEALQASRVGSGSSMVMPSSRPNTIKWIGLDDLESSWKLALSIYEDAKARSNQDGMNKMIDDLTSACGHPM